MAGPGVPRWWNCQVCRHPLDIVGADFAADRSTGEPSRGGHGPHLSVMGTGSVISGSRMDNSFVVLPKQRSPTSPLPFPPRPRPGTHVTSSGLPDVGRPLYPGQSQASSAGPPQAGPGPGNVPPGQYPDGPAVPHQPGAGAHGYVPAGSEGAGLARGMEESFVVLPSSAASMYRHEGSGDSAATGVAAPAGHGSLDARIMALTRVFELAAQQTLVEHPLCTECARAFQEELNLEVREAEEDIAAYEACLQRLELEQQQQAMSEEEFAREKQKAEEEERQVAAELAAVEEQRAAVQRQVAEVERKAAQVDELQKRYWHDWNDFKLQLSAHQEERDAVLAGLEVAAAQLEALQRTNVLNDAFHIWFEGDFGTINGFRLGRLPNVPVEWDEINAAWGQACLLLFTMAQTCQVTFTYRILPMGSYPRIADAKTSYDLFGPVNLFWSTRYDKAMVLFLACLREFAEFAHAKDRAAGIPPEKCFQLPYKIDNDKVNSFTIKQSFNRDERWTKALKYTLCGLKWAAAWLINNATTPGQSVRGSGSGSGGQVAALRRSTQTDKSGSLANSASGQSSQIADQ